MSLSLITEFAPSGSVIDVGGGASPLAGRLLEADHAVAVLDLSRAAIDRARQRLGKEAERIRWIVGDVTTIGSVGKFDVWHDRAAFHFLTARPDREHYIRLLSETIPADGHAIIATFAPDGPSQCSGLDVARYDGQSLLRELGNSFRLLKSVPETHVTPWGKPQSFQYAVFSRV